MGPELGRIDLAKIAWRMREFRVDAAGASLFDHPRTGRYGYLETAWDGDTWKSHSETYNPRTGVSTETNRKYNEDKNTMKTERTIEGPGGNKLKTERKTDYDTGTSTVNWTRCVVRPTNRSEFDGRAVWNTRCNDDTSPAGGRPGTDGCGLLNGSPSAVP